MCVCVMATSGRQCFIRSVRNITVTWWGRTWADLTVVRGGKSFLECLSKLVLSMKRASAATLKIFSTLFLIPPSCASPPAVCVIPSDARECFYLDDSFTVAAVLLVKAGPSFFLARRLLKMNDAFKLRQELVLTIGISSVLGGRYGTEEALQPPAALSSGTCSMPMKYGASRIYEVYT